MYDPPGGLVAEVVTGLGDGWSLNTERDRDLDSLDGEVLNGPAGAQLHMYLYYKDTGRVVVAGMFPRTLTQYRQHAVTVAMARGAGAIVTAIKGRLFATYLPDLQQVLDYNAGITTDQVARQALASKLEATFPGSHTSVSGYHGQYTNTVVKLPGGFSGHITSSGDASTVQMALRVPTETALAMLDATLEDQPAWERALAGLAGEGVKAA